MTDRRPLEPGLCAVGLCGVRALCLAGRRPTARGETPTPAAINGRC